MGRVGRGYATAATGTAVSPEGVRAPSGEVHAWLPGTNATVCGLQLSRTRLDRLSHVGFAEALPESGGSAEFVSSVCPRCRAAVFGRGSQRSWQRHQPRP